MREGYQCRALAPPRSCSAPHPHPCFAVRSCSARAPGSPQHLLHPPTIYPKILTAPSTPPLTRLQRHATLLGPMSYRADAVPSPQPRPACAKRTRTPHRPSLRPHPLSARTISRACPVQPSMLQLPWSLPAIDRSAIDPVPGGEATAKGRQGARLRQSVSAPRGNTPDPAQTNPSPARAETNPSPRHPANCTNEFLPAHARPMAHPRVTPYGLPDRTSARHPSTPEAKTRTGRQPAEPHPCHARHPDLPGPQPEPASPSALTPLGLPARRGTWSTIRRFTRRSLPPCQWRASQSLSPARPCRGMPLTRRLVRYI